MNEESPYVVELSKRIRYVRKKLDRIEKLESIPHSTEPLDDDQKLLLANKHDFEARLAELQVLRSKFEACEHTCKSNENLEEKKKTGHEYAEVNAGDAEITPDHPEPIDPIVRLTEDLQELVSSGAMSLEDALRICPGFGHGGEFLLDVSKHEGEEKQEKQPEAAVEQERAPTVGGGSSPASQEVASEIRAQDALRRLILLLVVTQHWGDHTTGEAGGPHAAPLPEAVALLGRSILGHGQPVASSLSSPSSPAAGFQALVDRAARDALLYVLGDPDRPLVADQTVGQLRDAVDTLVKTMRAGTPSSSNQPPAPVPEVPEPNVVPAAPKTEAALKPKAASRQLPKTIVDCPICGVKCGDLSKHTALKHPSAMGTHTAPELTDEVAPASSVADALVDVDEDITFGASDDEVSTKGEDEACGSDPNDGPMLHFGWTGGYEAWAPAVESSPTMIPANCEGEQSEETWKLGVAETSPPIASLQPPAGHPAATTLKPPATSSRGNAAKEKVTRRSKKRSDAEANLKRTATTMPRQSTQPHLSKAVQGKDRNVSPGRAGGVPLLGGSQVPAVQGKGSHATTPMSPPKVSPPNVSPPKKTPKSYLFNPSGPGKEESNPVKAAGANKRGRSKRPESDLEKYGRQTSNEFIVESKAAVAGKGSKGIKNGKGEKKAGSVVTAAPVPRPTTATAPAEEREKVAPNSNHAPLPKLGAPPVPNAKAAPGAPPTVHGKGRGHGKGGAKEGEKGSKANSTGDQPGKGQPRGGAGGKGTKPPRKVARLPPPAPPTGDLTWDSACTPVASV